MPPRSQFVCRLPRALGTGVDGQCDPCPWGSHSPGGGTQGGAASPRW